MILSFFFSLFYLSVRKNVYVLKIIDGTFFMVFKVYIDRWDKEKYLVRDLFI